MGAQGAAQGVEQGEGSRGGAGDGGQLDGGGAVGTNEEQDYYLEDEESQPQLTVEHESNLDSLGAGPEDFGPDYQSPQVAEKQVPVRSQKVANRNEKVNVQYMDGRIMRDVKYKTVEQDLLENRCVLVD